MGSFGPVRVDVPKDATQPRADPPLVARTSRRCSTRSDLVFVDAVGTGWSTRRRARQDARLLRRRRGRARVRAVHRALVTRNGRWQSPKFLFGESYGTTRAANVVNVLQQDGVAVNGVVLLSSALDYNVLPIGNGPGKDYVYIGYLPTEAAVAWYHHKVAGRPPDLARFVNEVRAFAGGAVRAGAHARRHARRGDARADRREAARVHGPVDGVHRGARTCASTRTASSRSCCVARACSVGRYDGRYTGPEIDPNGTYVDDDFSDTMTSAAYRRARSTTTRTTCCTTARSGRTRCWTTRSTATGSISAGEDRMRSTSSPTCRPAIVQNP